MSMTPHRGVKRARSDGRLDSQASAQPSAVDDVAQVAAPVKDVAAVPPVPCSQPEQEEARCASETAAADRDDAAPSAGDDCACPPAAEAIHEAPIQGAAAPSPKYAEPVPVAECVPPTDEPTTAAPAPADEVAEVACEEPIAAAEPGCDMAVPTPQPVSADVEQVEAVEAAVVEQAPEQPAQVEAAQPDTAVAVVHVAAEVEAPVGEADVDAKVAATSESEACADGASAA